MEIARKNIDFAPRVEVIGQNDRALVATVVLLDQPMVVIDCRKTGNDWQCEVRTPSISSVGVDTGKFCEVLERKLGEAES